jgi:hypothetical protein
MVTLMSLTLPAAARTCDTRFQLLNHSGRTVVDVNFDPARDDCRHWRADRLLGTRLEDGEGRNVAPPLGGRYGFRVASADGGTAGRLAVDICRTSGVNSLDGRITAE